MTRAGSDAGLTDSLRLLSWTLLLIVTERIAVDASQRKRIVYAVLVSAWLMLATIALAVVQNRYGAAYYAGKFEAVGQGPHGLSSYVVLCAVIVMYMMLQSAGGRWSFLLFGLSTVAVLLSLVRTTFLALLILVAAYALLALAGRGSRSRGFSSR